MDEIYLLSLIIAGLVLLPIIYLVIRCSIKTGDKCEVILYYSVSEHINLDEVQKINELWWDEHFCGSARGRRIAVVSQNLSDCDFEMLKKHLDKVMVLRPDQLSEYLRTEFDEGTKAL